MSRRRCASIKFELRDDVKYSEIYGADHNSLRGSSNCATASCKELG